MITVGSIVTPRVPVKVYEVDRPSKEVFEPEDEGLYARLYSRTITPAERFEVITTDGVESVISPITGGEDLTASCPDLELWD